ncbi:hypothetical protein [Novosphingobium sp. KA1]|uniref:hypothetical protein n=1 Tax=Novosphingobium sp. (strain KA1) TaxID=164608 RepID=UPI001A8C2053|nr:hypothetical protein [Novosphingobium sp. KA1]QSR19070.1 hypothetical protein CA833_17915 [Novosphingobium sp. KA1]
MLVDGNVTRPLADELEAGLVAQGFSASDRGAYLVQLTVSDLPGRAGLFAPSEGGASAGAWLLAPSRSRSRMQRVVVLSLSDRATGRNLYRVLASEPRKAGKTGKAGRAGKAGKAGRAISDARIVEAVASRLAAARQAPVE